MKEGLIASSYECPKCNEKMGLNERKSVVLMDLNGDVEKKKGVNTHDVCRSIRKNSWFSNSKLIGNKNVFSVITPATQKACSTITSLSIYGVSRSLTQRRDFSEFFKSSCYTLPSTWEGSTIRKVVSGHGNLVVKVTDSWPACHEFEPSTTKDSPCRGATHVKSVEA
ncbi:hypothetical protein TNCV_1874441 [Trichonephila clavipes]|nr:hypothetical protein TNCV_1874441 [Trichonephila clavipes]